MSVSVEIRIENDHSNELKQRIQSRIPSALMAGGMAVEGYAKNLAPVDTGNLRNSISTKPSGDKEVQIGTGVEYAIYQELGTRKMAPHAFLRPGIANNVSAIVGIIAQALK